VRLERSTGQLVRAIAAIGIAAAGAIAVACGGGGTDADDPPDLSKVPTATIPAELPDPIIVGQGAANTGGGRTYTIRAGDTLASIASSLGIDLDDLRAANPEIDPAQLRVGDRINLPEDVEANPTPAEEPTEAPAEPTSTPIPAPTATPASLGQTYTVQAGDIPVTIAEKFGITVEELLAANPGIDPRGLQVGDVLIIPAPSAEGD